MPYCADQDVRALCKLIDPTEIDPGEVTGFITKAETRINATLKQRYTVPLADPVPAIIQSIAADMAASFVLDKHYSDRMKDQTSLAEVYFKRAEHDLRDVVEKNLLEGEPGVVEVPRPQPPTRKPIGSTTGSSYVSPIQAALEELG